MAIIKKISSRWQDLFNHLKSYFFDVYSPGMKLGECTKPYVVIRHDGSARRIGISTDDDFYTIMCYVPRNAYSMLEPMIQRMKFVMKKIEPMFMPNGYQSPSFYDDELKAHMVSIQYLNHKKMLRSYDDINEVF